MKFKAPIQPEYESGTIKSVIRFAWLPKRVGEYYILFRRYETLYIYNISKLTGNIGGKAMEILVKTWLKVEERAL